MSVREGPRWIRGDRCARHFSLAYYYHDGPSHKIRSVRPRCSVDSAYGGQLWGPGSCMLLPLPSCVARVPTMVPRVLASCLILGRGRKNNDPSYKEMSNLFCHDHITTLLSASTGGSADVSSSARDDLDRIISSPIQ